MRTATCARINQSRRLREGDALADAIYNMRSRLDDDAPRGDAASRKLSEAVGLLRSRMDVEARRTAADLATLEAALRLFVDALPVSLLFWASLPVLFGPY